VRAAASASIVISVKPMVSGAILALCAAMACAGAVLAPETYLRINLTARFAGADLTHWLGRDDLGRDTLNRLLTGATTTVGDAVAVVVVALCAGALLDMARRAYPRFGIVIVVLARACFIAPGFLLRSRPAANFVMTMVSVALLLPGYVAVIAAAAYLGPGAANSVISLGLLFAVAAGYALAAMDRSSVRNGDDGGDHRMIAIPYTALALRLFAWATLSVSALDAIGLGTMPPRLSWGTMLGGLSGWASARGPVIAASACLLLAATAAIMLADALRTSNELAT
jgi:peptide/nickel transport system permease protein